MLKNNQEKGNRKLVQWTVAKRSEPITILKIELQTIGQDSLYSESMR